MTPDRQRLANGYRALFDERMRAAHIGTLLHAQANEPDRWPTILTVRKFAKVFDVPSAHLGAFFGLICRVENGRELWVDLLGRGPGWHIARHLMTREQATAFGFTRMALG